MPGFPKMGPPGPLHRPTKVEGSAVSILCMGDLCDWVALMKDNSVGGIERQVGGSIERGLNKRFTVWGTLTVSRFHRVKTSSLFKGAHERTSHNLFSSAASH